MRLAAVLSAALLSGCASLNPNIAGDFSCKAPNGVCAQVSTIDAGAVAALPGAAAPVGGVVPALPSVGEPQLVRASAVPGQLGRSAERVLKIVFPAQVDVAGVYHAPSVAHAVVERAGWVAAPTSPAVAAPASLDEIVAASAPRHQTTPALALPPQSSTATPGQIAAFNASALSPQPQTLREAVAGLAAHPVSALDQPARVPVTAPASVPSADAIAAARRGHGIGDDPAPSDARGLTTALDRALGSGHSGEGLFEERPQ